MEPIKGNSLNKSCGDVISSNCVTWAGPAVPGVCGPSPSLTEVVMSVKNSLDSCCSAQTSCYTGNWVPLSFSTTGSGTSGGAPFTYTITDIGFAGTYDVPQYRWTKEGDLSMRGAFRVNLTCLVQRNFVDIPLGSIDRACLPANFSKDQSILVSMDEGVVGNGISVIHAELILEHSTGNITLELSFATVTPVVFNFDIDLGGTRFNLA